MKILFSTLNSKYIHSNLGIYSVAAYLDKQQLEIDLAIKEYTIQTPVLSVLADVYEYQPQIIALATYIWNKDEIFKLTKALKQVLPEAIIVLGGPEVSFMPLKILQENSEIDYIVQGEGEEVFVELVRAILQKQASIRIKGVSSKQHIGFDVVTVEKLDILPFAYTQLELPVENKIIYYESTRGCPFSCSYCLSGISRNVRKRSLELVLQELGYFIDKKVKQVKFVDRTYNLDAKHYLKIMQYLAKQETNTNFHFEIKADLLTEEVLAFLRTVPKGRFQFEIGIQTTNLKTLEAINRQDNWELLAANIEKLLSFENMHIHVDLIAGLPYEDLLSFAKSFDAVYNLSADVLQLGFLKLLAGSQIDKEKEKHEYRYLPQPPYEVLSNKYMPYSDLRLLKLVEDMLDRFYNSNKYKNALKYIIENLYRKNAFSFYQELALFAQSCGVHLQSSATKQNLTLFINFVEKNFSLHESSLICELLNLDMFIAQEGWRHEFFPCISESVEFNELFMAFWRNLALVQKYLPNYEFTNWRQIKKIYPMEIFKLPVGEKIYLYNLESEQLIEIAREDFYENI